MNLMLGGNTVIDKHPFSLGGSRETPYRKSLHATETEISSILIGPFTDFTFPRCDASPLQITTGLPLLTQLPVRDLSAITSDQVLKTKTCLPVSDLLDYPVVSKPNLLVSCTTKLPNLPHRVQREAHKCIFRLFWPTYGILFKALFFGYLRP